MGRWTMLVAGIECNILLFSIFWDDLIFESI